MAAARLSLTGRTSAVSSKPITSTTETTKLPALSASRALSVPSEKGLPMPSGKDFIDSLKTHGSGGLPQSGPDWSTITKVIIATLIELGLFVLHYTVYAETLSVMPGEYLADIPGLEWLFTGTDLQVNHMVAGSLALVTVATPVVGFYLLLKNRVFSQPGAFFGHMPNRVYVAILALFWAIVVATELSNVLALIESYVSNPFIGGEEAETLRTLADYALLVATVVSLVNAAVALFTASLWHSILSRRGH
ncbi:MAG: hypothetical protein KC777_25585 [Cyanobacteria bacterium HKST-UBA02]|nr:hypothetical protein [Cyanobacteria bacterium HKST-UBA02]